MANQITHRVAIPCFSEEKRNNFMSEKLRMRTLFLIAFLVTIGAAACKKGVGEKCQNTRDCSNGDICLESKWVKRYADRLLEMEINTLELSAYNICATLVSINLLKLSNHWLMMQYVKMKLNLHLHICDALDKID